MGNPSLKVVGLHIEKLRALRDVDWPRDGSGWSSAGVPDMVMVGGINGSGKTTLLEFIAAAAAALDDATSIRLNMEAPGTNRIDLGFRFTDTAGVVRIVPRAVSDERIGDDWSASDVHCAESDNAAAVRLLESLRTAASGSDTDLPAVVFLPTDRNLSIPDTDYKAPGQLEQPQGFLQRFEPATQWNASIEALLYAARWADLNAKEEGRPQDATHFASYATTVESLYEGARKLIWREGKLLVEVTGTGETHDLGALSSGEKQVLIIAAELLRRWRPGSLILIDEPELHLHPHWQTKLWELLVRWRNERGGQVIVTTQSTHLFRIAEPGCQVLLGRRPLR